MAPLRIIQVVHAFEPQVGGIETHVQELSLALARRGAEVVVHTASPSRASDAPLAAQVDARLSKAGVIVKRHFAVKFPLFSSLIWIPGLPIFIALERGDAVCAHGFGALAPICAAIGAALSGKPFYWTIHGLPRFRGLFGSLALGLYRTLLAPFGFVLSRKIIAVSSPVADGLREMGVRNEVVIIPNGISERFLDAAAPFSPPSPFTIQFVGRLDASKGVRLLAHAFIAFHARHAESRLRFIGPDEGERAGLERYAKENGLSFEFIQARSVDLPALYSSASVTVLPSEYEGFGLCMLESWACGTPALSTPVGAAPQFIQAAFGPRANRFLFKDEQELVERLEAVYSARPAERRAWASAARVALSAYHWDAVAKQTLDALKI